MRALLAGSLLLALVAGHPSSAAVPETATIRGELAVACAGCGTTTASFTGVVVAGTLRFVPGNAVTGSFTLTQPAATCPATETASGTLTMYGVVVARLEWSRAGSAIAGTAANGGRVAGTSAFTAPSGNPCGGPARAAVTITISPPAGAVASEAGSAARAAYEDVRGVRRDTRAALAPTVDPLVQAATPVQLRSWVDGIHIIAQTSFGGPFATYEGAFADPALWDCTEVMWPGTPTVTCVADAGSGIDWECGLMHAQAKALTEQDFDEPWITYWGAAAAYVSCDNDVLVTPQANQSNPVAQAQTPMGAVTTVVCKAQLDSNDGSPALAPYHVICVDPPYAR